MTKKEKMELISNALKEGKSVFIKSLGKRSGLKLLPSGEEHLASSKYGSTSFFGKFDVENIETISDIDWRRKVEIYN